MIDSKRRGTEAIFYFCRRGLGTHFQYYMGWVVEARKAGLPIKLFTTISLKEYLNKPEYMNHPYIVLVPCPKKLDKMVVFLFFLYQFIRNKFTLVQLRKRSPAILVYLGKIFSNFRYIIEMEGDHRLERDYLMENCYREGLYDDIIKTYNHKIRTEKKRLNRADHIICVSKHLKETYMSRYGIEDDKITVLGTGGYSEFYHFDENQHKSTRKLLHLNDELTLVYVGGIFYSWQNISRTLAIFNIIKEMVGHAKFIIIVKEDDAHILNYFIQKNNMCLSDLIIRYSVPNNKVPHYLNAADIGIIIRDAHPMNKMVSPGKFGDYACCGLPIITSTGISDFSEKLLETPYGIVLSDIRDDAEFRNKFTQWLPVMKTLNRNEISTWGIDNFSFKPHLPVYSKLLRRLMTEDCIRSK